jgi:hypothetical protein
VFSGYPIAMRVTGEGIEFLERDPNSVEPTWRNAVAGSLRSRTWRDGIRVELAEINSGSNTNSNLARNAATTSGGRSVPREQIVTFLPTGIGVPFSMRIFSDQFQRVIDGDALGNVAFRQ